MIILIYKTLNFSYKVKSNKKVINKKRGNYGTRNKQ